MKQPVRIRHRTLIALATLAFVLSLGGTVARADDHDDRGHDGRSRYYSDHRYGDDKKPLPRSRRGSWPPPRSLQARQAPSRRPSRSYDYYDRGYRDGGYYDRG